MKRLAGIVVAIGVSVLFSGCLVMRTLVYTDDVVDAGTKSTALITVQGELAANERPVVFFFREDAETRLTNGGKFDTTQVFGGPADLRLDTAVAAALEESCGNTVPTKAPDPDPMAVTTEEPFAMTNSNKIVDVKLPVKVSTVGKATAFAIFMASWTDDGDDVPEDADTSDDEYACQPPYVSTLRIKGGAPAR
jgi:hypothetical protein